MIQGVLKKIFGSRNERLLKQYGRIVRQVNAFEPDISALSDDQLRAKTDEFRKRIQEHLAGVAPSRPASDEPAAENADAAVPPSDEDSQGQQSATAPGQDTPVDRARRDILDEILPEAFAVVREAG